MSSRGRASVVARSPFVDVSPAGARPPSWIAQHAAPRLDVDSLRPAPLPREFIDAVQSELQQNAAKLDAVVAARRSTHPPPAMSPQSSQSSEFAALEQLTPAARSSRPAKEPSSPFAASLLGQQAAMEEAKTAVAQAIRDLVDARALIYETTAGQLAELAATIARRVIAHELETRNDIVRRLIDEGIAALECREQLVVRLGTAFAELRDQLADELDGRSQQVQVVVDLGLSRYGCVVESAHGWVDESIESRLAALLQELRADERKADSDVP